MNETSSLSDSALPSAASIEMPSGGSSEFHGGGTTVTLSSTATRVTRTTDPAIVNTQTGASAGPRDATSPRCGMACRPRAGPRCKGVKHDGTRCGAFQGRSGFCFNHDPTIDATRKHNVKVHGGQSTRVARAQRMLPPRFRAVFDRLDVAMVDVLDGTLSPTRASALAALSTASVRVLQAGEFEEELRRLRAAIGDDLDDDPTPALSEGD